MHILILLLIFHAQLIYSAAHEPTDLFRHVESGRLFETKQLLTARPDWLDIRNELGQTPLCVALIHQRTHIIRDLLQRGADVHARDDEQNSLFHYALPHVLLNTEYCISLLERGHSLTYCCPKHSPLVGATLRNNVMIVRTLLEMKAPVDAPDAHGCTALAYAAKENRKIIAKNLMEYGANPIAVALGRSAEEWAADAAQKGDPEMCFILKKRPNFSIVLGRNIHIYLASRELHGSRPRKEFKPKSIYANPKNEPTA